MARRQGEQGAARRDLDVVRMRAKSEHRQRAAPGAANDSEIMPGPACQ